MPPDLTMPRPIPCEVCGAMGVTVEFSRERGMGAELLIRCPACGHEQYEDISEDVARKMREFADRQSS